MNRVEISQTDAEDIDQHVDVNAKGTKDAFLKAVRDINPNADLTLIGKAYEFAYEAHKNQTRISGEPYFTHLLETSCLLLELKPGSSTLCAGLLHDIIEDTTITRERIEREFGSEILELIEGVSKIERLGESRTVTSSENLRKIILAMSKDIRIILIKLADRLHNMRTLKHLPREKQIEKAREAIEIFAPIAYKLGMYKIKAELEDLGLRYLEPERYQEIKQKINQTKKEREHNIAQAITIISEHLTSAKINAKVHGRAKHFTSIISKMKRKNLAFEDLHDLLAVRVITDTVENCYRVLGIVHTLFRPIPGGLNDYIANPKPNMYQSLHTDVIWKGRPLEVQIRTWDMHFVAEYGVASHWRYKGSERDKKFDQRLEWLKQILEWRMSEDSADHFIENLKIDLFQNEIVVFTPKGDPIVLPENATPIDFAYEIHSQIGNTATRAKVNGVQVPLDRALEPGDIIEIITQKNAKPSRAWLQFVKTSNARTKIRSRLGLRSEEKKRIRIEEDHDDEILRWIEQDSKRALRYSRCCKPQRGDTIGGSLLKDGRIAVHRKDCENYRAARVGGQTVELRWIRASKNPNLTLTIETQDRIGMLSDLLNTITTLALDIRNVRTKRGKETFFIHIELTVPNESDIDKLTGALRDIPDVIRVAKDSEPGRDTRAHRTR
jgi:GTP diphosphokinase / guanosine-3',5'-bis(diphosphate) 3'-diphosphatase